MSVSLFSRVFMVAWILSAVVAMDGGQSRVEVENVPGSV